MPFTEELFDCEEEKAARIPWAILETLLAYALGLMVGEAVQDEVYGEEGEKGGARRGRKWKLYSGLFVLLKKRPRLTMSRWRAILARVLERWKRRLFPPFPTSV